MTSCYSKIRSSKKSKIGREKPYHRNSNLLSKYNDYFDSEKDALNERKEEGVKQMLKENKESSDCSILIVDGPKLRTTSHILQTGFDANKIICVQNNMNDFEEMIENNSKNVTILFDTVENAVAKQKENILFLDYDCLHNLFSRINYQTAFDCFVNFIKKTPKVAMLTITFSMRGKGACTNLAKNLNKLVSELTKATKKQVQQGYTYPYKRLLSDGKRYGQLMCYVELHIGEWTTIEPEWRIKNVVPYNETHYEVFWYGFKESTLEPKQFFEWKIV